MTIQCQKYTLCRFVDGGCLKVFFSDPDQKNLSCFLTTQDIPLNSLIAPDFTAAMLMERTIAKKVFWKFDSIIMQNLSNILLLFWHQHGER